MKNKKGSHVGVVLSFVMFITFIVFLYSILGPKVITEDKEAFLDFLRLEMLEKLSANLTRVTVSIENPSSCIQLNNFLSEAEINSKIIVKDSDEDIIDSEISSGGSDLLIKSSEDFFKVYYSGDFDELDEETESCTELEIDTGYSIALIRNEEYVFAKRVTDLIEEYESEGGYEDLKEELRIPSGAEFGISFVYANESIIQTDSRDFPGNVYVREIPVQYIDEDTNILLGTLNVHAW